MYLRGYVDTQSQPAHVTPAARLHIGSARQENDLTTVQNADVGLSQNRFMAALIRHLSGTLQDVVGLDDAEGFISLVGQQIGDDINHDYRRALSLSRLSRSEVSEVLVDLKRRIDGDFYVIEENDQKIVLGNNRCPFGAMVEGRPSLCMMTSNVFGAIAAENLGYAKVSLEKTIANGHGGCTVVVYLQDTEESRDAEGREYFDMPDA